MKMIKDILLKLLFNILKSYTIVTMISSFLPEGMKIEKFKKLIANLHDKEEYVIHIRNLKQSLNHGFVLKKVHRIIKINQKSWLKPCIHMNTDPRKKARNDF